MKQKKLKEKVAKFPKLPGVYLMKSGKGEVLYVGKASNLRSRVNSYFLREAESRYQVRFLMSRVEEIEPLITDTPKEALLLENTLIKKYRPRYNVHLKDDKSYISLKLSIKDKAPRLYITRRIKKDGNLYFGPYTSAISCREVVDFIQTHFRLRTCSDHEYRNRVRPCLQYEIKRCDAPCVGLIHLNEYAKVVKQVRLFLEGRSDELKKMVIRLMKEASAKEEYEEAARYRDMVGDIEKMLERQKVVSHQHFSRDVIGVYREGPSTLYYVMMVREGSLQDSCSYLIKSYEEEEDSLSSFLRQFYEEERAIPREILIPNVLEDQEIVEEILEERSGHRVKLIHPRRGEKASLIQLSHENAKQAFLTKSLREESQREILETLKKGLHLKNFPKRIECYDISNFQGGESMGAMVTFLDGKPTKKLFRSFRIKTVRGANDFASLYEVLARRFRRIQELKEGSPEDAWAKPDLMVIDGGKGQLNAAHQVFKDLGIEGIDLISLAKSRLKPGVEGDIEKGPRERSEERVFLLGRKDPVFFPPKSRELFLLIQVRDEAHRFSIESHRRLRGKRTLHSSLDKIKGVGKVRRQKLLNHFGTIQGIRKAKVEEIVQLLSCSRELGVRIRESL